MTPITSLGNTDSAVRQFLSSTATYFSRPLAILRNYHLSDLQPDLLSGLTVGVVMLPQAMAYALIAELPPETGLYAAIVASIIGALWGSSSHLHTGPTNAASLLVLSTLSTVALVGSPEYLAAAGLLAVMVGIFRLVMGLARMGMLVNFVSDSVIIGFTAGAGVLIAVNQLKHLFGIPVESSPLFLQTLFDLIANLDQIHWASLAVGLLTIGVMLLIQWKTPKIPSALAGMIVASLAVFVFNLDEKGVAVLGALPRGLPPLAPVPIFDWQLISQLSTGALAISLIGLVEAMSIARAIASQSGEHIDNNQEFVGQGLANIATGFFSGYTCSGSFTRSAVNFASGGRTAIAVVASGIFVLLAMFVVAPLAAYIPRAALAALLVVTAYRMVDLHEIRRIWHTTKGDSFIMAATLAATLFLPLEFAVLTGVLASFARFIA
jgi:SulP family sulfate permease